MGLVDDIQLVQSHRRVRAVEAEDPCGGGIPQPTWPACTELGKWLVHGYQHPYCIIHAAARLRAHERLEATRS